jgi:hypothetical protein
MKALPRHLFLSLFLAAMAAVTPAFGREGSRGQTDSGGATARVKFSDRAKPGTLKLSLPWAEARITATDGDEVIVSSTLDEKSRRNEVDDEGFRRLDEDLTFELVEKNNVATIVVAGDNPWLANGAEFDIKVPRNTNLILRTEAGGDIEVEGVEGDIDINSMNGEVTLKDIVSSAVVNTMNGEVHVSFAKAPVKPVSLSSMNGEIDLRLPGDTKANLRMRTHNGSIRTNFPEGTLQAKTDKTARGPAGDSREQREYQREMARLDRERARMERETNQAVAAAVAEANMAISAAVSAGEPDAERVPTTPRAPRTPATPAPAVAPVAPVAPVMPVPPVPNFGGKSIVGTLNGGGVDIKLTSMNGTITLRESK